MKLRFTRAAEEDLEDIYREGIRLFGPNQAAAYLGKLQLATRAISEFPYANQVRDTHMGDVRIHRSGAHIIVYIIHTEDNAEIVSIVRVRHGREDWQAD